MRRVGPILQGLILEVSVGRDLYVPKFHLHNLCCPFPTLTLGVATRLQTYGGAPDFIDARWNDRHWKDAASRMREQSPLSLCDDLRVDEIIQMFQEYLTQLGEGYNYHLYENMVTLAVWCGKPEVARAKLDEAIQWTKSWPQYVLDQFKNREGNVEIWAATYGELIKNPDTVCRTAEEEMNRHKVGKLPMAELLY